MVANCSSETFLFANFPTKKLPPKERLVNQTKESAIDGVSLVELPNYRRYLCPESSRCQIQVLDIIVQER